MSNARLRQVSRRTAPPNRRKHGSAKPARSYAHIGTCGSVLVGLMQAARLLQ